MSAATASDRPARIATRAAQGMAALARALPPGGPLAAPPKGRGVRIPAGYRLGQPGFDLLGRLRMLAGERPPGENPLDRLGQVEPRAGDRRVQRQEAPVEQVLLQFPVAVSRQIVPDEQHPQWRQALRPPGRQGRIDPVFPAAPPGGSAGAGRQAARIAASSRRSHSCNTALGARSTGAARTAPVAGRNSVSSLAVPPRRYSCGWRAGSPCGCQDAPGWGTAWYGPASSSHHTCSPQASPRR